MMIALQIASYIAISYIYRGTSNKGSSKIRQPPNKGRSSGPLFHSSSSFLTSEKRTTSQRRIILLVPKCPLFGGSTVYIHTVVPLCIDWSLTHQTQLSD